MKVRDLMAALKSFDDDDDVEISNITSGYGLKITGVYEARDGRPVLIEAEEEN